MQEHRGCVSRGVTGLAAGLSWLFQRRCCHGFDSTAGTPILAAHPTTGADESRMTYGCTRPVVYGLLPGACGARSSHGKSSGHCREWGQ